jgi:DNA-binding Lrp family transcriptional regulator
MMTAMTAPSTGIDRLRPRRSCLAVPGSNPRFLEKAQGLPADQVFLDLEDACAPLVKESARHMIVDALNTGDWTGKTRVVRVNDWTTQWTYRDVVTVVEGAGQNLDCLMLPKVQDAGQITALDLLLTQIEKTMGFEVGRIGIEAQIENARGLVNVDEIAAASPRLETIVFGPADFMASINMKSLVVGEQPLSITLDRQSQAGLEAFESAVRKVPEVMECYLMTGEHDYLLRLVVADMADFERVHNQHLTRLPSVARVHSSFAMRTVTRAVSLPAREASAVRSQPRA